jgi:hypothetical protein
MCPIERLAKSVGSRTGAVLLRIDRAVTPRFLCTQHNRSKAAGEEGNQEQLCSAAWPVTTKHDDVLDTRLERAGAEFKQEPGADRLANLVDYDELFRSMIAEPELLACVEQFLGSLFKLSSLNARSVPPMQTGSTPGTVIRENCRTLAAIGFATSSGCWMISRARTAPHATYQTHLFFAEIGQMFEPGAVFEIDFVIFGGKIRRTPPGKKTVRLFPEKSRILCRAGCGGGRDGDLQRDGLFRHSTKTRDRRSPGAGGAAFLQEIS